MAEGMIEAATQADVELVAWTVLTALDLSADDLTRAVGCCSDPRSIYSWRRALVAKVDGRAVGCIIAYDGADYLRLRERSWAMIWPEFDASRLKGIALETGAGEFYLDSMAILPQFRGRGLGKALMLAAIAQGRQRGFRQFALIVDVDKPRLQQYYQSIGFTPADSIDFFGHRFNRLRLGP